MYYIEWGKLKERKAKDFSEAFGDKGFVEEFNKMATPIGMKYVGGFFASIGADHDVEMWYEIENYGVLDKTRNTNAELKALREKWLGKYGNIFEWSKSKILIPISEANLIDPSKVKKD